MKQKKFAYLISRIFEPAVLVVVLSFLVILETSLSAKEAIIWLSVILIIGVLIPVLIYFIGRKMGKISDSEITKRAERIPFYTAVLLCWLILIFVLKIFNAPQFIFIILQTAALLGVVFVGITLFWKISIHAGIFTVFSLSLVILYGRAFIPTLLLIILIGWARVRLGQHTIFQLLAGLILAAIIFLFTLYYNGVTL